MTISHDEAVKKAKWLFEALQRIGPATPARRGLLEQGGIQLTLLAIDGRRRILEDPDGILSAANRSSPKYFRDYNALLYGAAYMLSEGEDIPDQIRHWAADNLRGRVEAPTGEGGKPPNVVKSPLICLVLGILKERGMSPTRNKAGSSTSGCDAVAQALAELGQSPRTYDGVKKIWERRSKLRDGCH